MTTGVLDLTAWRSPAGMWIQAPAWASTVDLLVHLEQSYDTRISLEDLDLDNFRSIARIARFLSSPKGSNGHTDP